MTKCLLDILKPLYIKAEASAHAQTTIPHLYILFANILTRYHLKTYIEISLEKCGHKRRHEFGHVTFPGTFYDGYNFLVEMSKFKQGIKMTFNDVKDQKVIWQKVSKKVKDQNIFLEKVM